MAEVARREFAVGDRVTIDTQPDIVTGLTTIYRISALKSDDVMLVPTNTPDIRPRIRTAATVTLVKARRTTHRPITIAEVARCRLDHPDHPFWKPLNEFLDEFYENLNDGIAAFEEEPCAIDPIEAAQLAAATEYLCGLYDHVAPAWIEKPGYFLVQAYYVWGETIAVRALFERESPPSFRRRNIMTEAEPLRRKLGPKRKPLA